MENIFFSDFQIEVILRPRLYRFQKFLLDFEQLVSRDEHEQDDDEEDVSVDDKDVSNVLGVKTTWFIGLKLLLLYWKSFIESTEPTRLSMLRADLELTDWPAAGNRKQIDRSYSWTHRSPGAAQLGTDTDTIVEGAMSKQSLYLMSCW